MPSLRSFANSTLGCAFVGPAACVESGGHGLSRGQAVTIWTFFSKL